MLYLWFNSPERSKHCACLSVSENVYCQQMLLHLLAGVLEKKINTSLYLCAENLIIVSGVVAGCYEEKAK